MDLKTYLIKKRQMVENALLRSIADPSIPETLKKAMAYSLEAGGKRLRPILVIAGAEAVGGNAEDVLSAGVAMEMIHTFSLIHDDLPTMDDDSLRRGRPTNHKVFGEATAILAGDALLAEAFYVLAGCRNAAHQVLINVVRDVAEAAGCRGMTGGQQLDMDATGKKITEDALTRLHLYKTGALIRVSVVSGARLGGATKSQLGKLARYGEAVGLAFQIADDILDIEGDEALIGKDVGSDIESDKSTFPAIIGMEASRAKAKNLVGEAVDLLSEFGEKAEPLRLIARYTIERNK